MAAQQYYLPCSCGKSTVVDAGVAGTTITCVCGNTLQVPKLRELRLLNPVSQPEPFEIAQASSTRPMGCLFSALITIALIAATVGAGAWFLRSRIDVSWSIEKDLAEGNRQIDRMAIDQAYEVWKNFDQVGIGPQQPPPFMLKLQMADRLKTTTMVSGAVLGGCLLAAAAVAVIDAQRARK